MSQFIITAQLTAETQQKSP